MRKADRGQRARRLSVPIAGDPEMAEVLRHPERIGLPRDTSRAQVAVHLQRQGLQSLRREAAERAELEAYAEWAHDRDGLEVVGALQSDGI